MIRMGNVWDRTVEVIGGRTVPLLAITTVGFVLPPLLRDGVAAMVPAGTATTLIEGVVSVLVVLMLLWGVLAITAMASDPAVDGGRASAIGLSRVPITGGLFLLLSFVALLLFLPIILVLANSGMDFTAMSRGAAPASGPELSGGSLAFVTLYALILIALFLWVTARLALLYPVIANERLGFASIRRSFSLSLGLAGRILGVLILYLIVVAVVLLAATSVTGIAFRLILGAENQTIVAFVVWLVSTLVTAGATLFQSIFVAQLYLAVRGERSDAAIAA